MKKFMMSDESNPIEIDECLISGRSGSTYFSVLSDKPILSSKLPYNIKKIPGDYTYDCLNGCTRLSTPIVKLDTKNNLVYTVNNVFHYTSLNYGNDLRNLLDTIE